MHASLTRRAVQRLAAESGLDVVHDHTLAGPLNAPAYAALGLPTVVTAHGPVDGELRRYYAALDKDIHLVAISDGSGELAPDLPWAGRCTTRSASTPSRSAGTRATTRCSSAASTRRRRRTSRSTPRTRPALPLVLAGKCAEPVEQEYFEREMRPRLTDDRPGLRGGRRHRQARSCSPSAALPALPDPVGGAVRHGDDRGDGVRHAGGGAARAAPCRRSSQRRHRLHLRRPGRTPEALSRLDRIDPDACRRRVRDHFDVAELGAGYEAVYRQVLATHTAAADGDLETLRRDYGDLNAALDRRYGRDLARGRRHSRAVPARIRRSEPSKKAGAA